MNGKKNKKIGKIINKLMQHKIEYEELKGDYSFNKYLIDKQKSEILQLLEEVEELVNNLISRTKREPPSLKKIDESISKEIRLVRPYSLKKEQLETFKLNYQYYQKKLSSENLNLKALINMYEKINRTLWIQSNEWKRKGLKKYKSRQDDREKVKKDMLYLLDALTLVIANTKDSECAPSSYSLGISAIYDINHKYSVSK